MSNIDLSAVRSFFLSLFVVLTGCATHVPQVVTPSLVPATFISADSSAQAWPQMDWWNGFESNELSALVTAAQAGNPDLAAAVARVLEAKARVGIAQSVLFPQLALTAQAQRSGVGVTQVTGSQPASSTGNAFNLNVSASYQLDVWGFNRANVRGQREAFKSARFAQQSVALTVISNVANQYVSVLALRERAKIVAEEIDAINGILSVIKLKVSVGKSSHLDLAQETALLESVEAQLPVLQQQEKEGRFSLAVLLGKTPDSLDIHAENLDGLRAPTVQPGLPSELLARRPDIAEAEANLASAHANVDAARLAFLPQFDLTGDGGYASTAIKALIRGPSFAWDAGASLLQTIFDGGKLTGQKRLADATESELIATYQKAVLSACADVESALTELSSSTTAEKHLRLEVDAAREAFEISQLQYRQGATDLLNLLQAQQTLFAARDQLAQIQGAHILALIHLYAALGGGWTESADERTQTRIPVSRG